MKEKLLLILSAVIAIWIPSCSTINDTVKEYQVDNKGFKYSQVFATDESPRVRSEDIVPVISIPSQFGQGEITFLPVNNEK